MGIEKIPVGKTKTVNSNRYFLYFKEQNIRKHQINTRIILINCFECHFINNLVSLF